MYEWRGMAEEERRRVLAQRKSLHRPWHRTLHLDCGENSYHLSGACYEHAPIIGKTSERMAEFEQELLETVGSECDLQVVSIESHSGESQDRLVVEALRPEGRTPNLMHACCILPNHYHLLIETADVKRVIHDLGKLRGRKSFQWNGEDGSRGRQVWYDYADRAIRSDRHFWVTMNYVHHNPVRHGYVSRWQDWPYSSAWDFLEKVGREEAARIWRECPLRDYGKGWDEPDL